MNEGKSRIGIRLTNEEAALFRLATTLHKTTAQDVLHQAVLQFIDESNIPQELKDNALSIL